MFLHESGEAISFGNLQTGEWKRLPYFIGDFGAESVGAYYRRIVAIACMDTKIIYMGRPEHMALPLRAEEFHIEKDSVGAWRVLSNCRTMPYDFNKKTFWKELPIPIKIHPVARALELTPLYFPIEKDTLVTVSNARASAFMVILRTSLT